MSDEVQIDPSRIADNLRKYYAPNEEAGIVEDAEISKYIKLRILKRSESRKKLIDLAFGRPLDGGFDPDVNAGFLYEALNALYRRRGYEGGLSHPKIEPLIKKLNDHLRAFQKGEVCSEWSEVYQKAKAGDRDEIETTIGPSVDAACEIGCILLRLFYVEALSADLLRAWKNYELFEYALNPRYRDHYVHLIHDFLTGCIILGELQQEIWDCRDKYARQSRIPGDDFKIRLMRSWLLAALFHDIGYPAETLRAFRDSMQNTFFDKIPGYSLGPLTLKPAEYLQDELKEIFTMISYIFTEDEFSFDFGRLSQFQRLKHYPERLVFGAMNALLQDRMEELDHGVMSAVFLLLTLKVDVHEFTLDSFRDPRKFGELTKNAEPELFRHERCELLEDAIRAALAIALHNLRTKGYPGMTIDFRTHPIAFLLSLVDDLQEWDRRKATKYGHAISSDCEIEGLYVVDFPRDRRIEPDDRDRVTSEAIAQLYGSLEPPVETPVGRWRSGPTREAAGHDDGRTYPDPSGATEACILVHCTVRDEEHLNGMDKALRQLFERNLSHGPCFIVKLTIAGSTRVHFIEAEYDHAQRTYLVTPKFQPR